MPVHDWRRVEAGIFHDFHMAWISALRNALNDGLLPSGYYALGEQHAGGSIADLLTLHRAPPVPPPPLPPPTTGTTLLAEAPPRTRRRSSLEVALLTRRRSLAIRHVSNHRIIALLEIVSPANKDRPRHVESFAAKAVDFLQVGVHVLLVDLFPPGPHDPHGMHGIIRQRLAELDEPCQDDEVPAESPLTLVSYAADLPRVDVYLEHIPVGVDLPDMPLFLNFDYYVNVPLEETYRAAYRGMPAFWRDVLEGRDPDAV